MCDKKKRIFNFEELILYFELMKFEFWMLHCIHIYFVVVRNAPTSAVFPWSGWRATKPDPIHHFGSWASERAQVSCHADR